MDENDVYTVKDVARFLDKNEETVKRWLRDEKRKNKLFPNAFKNSDKEGWKIPESDLQNLHTVVEKTYDGDPSQEPQQELDQTEEELVKLAYQAVTLSQPPEQIVPLLVCVGIRRTLEILLVMQKSPTPVKNPVGFIKKAIREGWTPETVATSIPQKEAFVLVDLTQKDFTGSVNRIKNVPKVPFHNWLGNQ